jgi:preprotein translocase subunit YajC
MKGSGIALLVIGSILLLGDGAYVFLWEPQQNQMQQEMQMA